MPNQVFQEAYSFDDLLLLPSYSAVLPKDVSVATQLTRRISLNIPIVSAAMARVCSSFRRPPQVPAAARETAARAPPLNAGGP
jgi:hypothetical protein